jgi:hypothetical protein
VTAHLAAGRGISVHVLIRVTGRNRTNGVIEELGLWTGVETVTVTLGGVPRTFHGAGELLDLDPFVSAIDLNARAWSFRVSPLAPEAVDILRTYDARDGVVQAWEWFHDPDTGLPLANPVAAFAGSIVELEIPTPALGQPATATVRAVSDARRLTRELTLKRSDTALQARVPGDLFRQYNSLVGVTTPWGERERAASGGFVSERWTGGFGIG